MTNTGKTVLGGLIIGIIITGIFVGIYFGVQEIKKSNSKSKSQEPTSPKPKPKGSTKPESKEATESNPREPQKPLVLGDTGERTVTMDTPYGYAVIDKISKGQTTVMNKGDTVVLKDFKIKDTGLYFISYNIELYNAEAAVLVNSDHIQKVVYETKPKSSTETTVLIKSDIQDMFLYTTSVHNVLNASGTIFLEKDSNVKIVIFTDKTITFSKSEEYELFMSIIKL